MAVRDDEVVSAGGRAPLVGWLMMQPDRDAISSIFLLDLKLQYSAGHLPENRVLKVDFRVEIDALYDAR